MKLGMLHYKKTAHYIFLKNFYLETHRCIYVTLIYKNGRN